jgi:VanZ family protein
MLTKTLHYWKSISFTLVILFLSFVPPAGLKKLPPINILNFDKIVHMLMYSLLTAIIIYDLKNKIAKSAYRKTFITTVFLYSIIFGGIVEIMQETWFYPRSAEWIDWIADIIGALIGIFGMYAFKQFRLKS